MKADNQKTTASFEAVVLFLTFGVSKTPKI